MTASEPAGAAAMTTTPEPSQAVTDALRAVSVALPATVEWTWRHNRYVAIRDATTDRAEAEAKVARVRALNPGDDVALTARVVTDWKDED